MPRKLWVHYRLVVEVEDAEDLDDAWEQATEILRNGGGEILGHSIVDDTGVVEESC